MEDVGYKLDLKFQNLRMSPILMRRREEILQLANTLKKVPLKMVIMGKKIDDLVKFITINTVIAFLWPLFYLLYYLFCCCLCKRRANTTPGDTSRGILQGFRKTLKKVIYHFHYDF
jgi:hypothetical protein